MQSASLLFLPSICSYHKNRCLLGKRIDWYIIKSLPLPDLQRLVLGKEEQYKYLARKSPNILRNSKGGGKNSSLRRNRLFLCFTDRSFKIYQEDGRDRNQSQIQKEFGKKKKKTLAGSRAYEGLMENILILFQFN